MKESLNFFSAGRVGLSRGCGFQAPGPGFGASRSCCRRTQCRVLGFLPAPPARRCPRDSTTAVSAASSSGVGSPLTTENTAFGRLQARSHGRAQSARIRGAHSGMFPCFLAGRLARLSRSARSPLMIWTRVSEGAITAST